MGAGRTRFMRGPSWTYASEMNSLSTSRSSLRFCALAMADCSTFSTVGAMRLLTVRSVVMAAPACLPRIISTTRRAFCGETRMYLASALIWVLGSMVYSIRRLRYAGFAVFSVAAFTEWPLNPRVGENSPSLCPTMFSVMYTGMNFLPLWTATVWPTNSGRMVERRDHVRTTFFSLVVESTASLASRCVSVNGPFLTDRPICAYLFLLLCVTIHLSVRLLLRVLKPRVGWPQGVTG